MSHFSVLVVGDDVQYQLAPFHEFECTGTDDEFVQNIDILEKARAEFDAAEAQLVIQRKDGTRFFAFADGDFVDELKPYYERNRRPMLVLPDGWIELRDEPAKDWQSFAEWLPTQYGLERIDGNAAPDMTDAHKYGFYRVVDGEVIEAVDRSNPNKKWDYWQIGGRFCDRLILKAAPGTLRSNSALKSEINFDAIRDDAGDQAAQRWDAAKQKRDDVGAGDTWEPWDAVRERITDMEQARGFYCAQPEVVATRHIDVFDVDQFLEPRDQYIERARNNSFRAYAFLKDRKWASIGDMGWWGISTNEMSDADWMQWFTAQIADLPDDARITIVDCHI